MAQVVPFLSTLVGGGGAAAAGGSSLLGGLSTALAIAGTVTSVIAANSAARAQEAAALRAAEIEQENADQARKAGRATAQDEDLEAAALLASIEAKQGASGLMISSPSFRRRQQRNAIAAATNRERIVEDSERQATSAENRAQTERISASNSRRERLFNTISGGIGIGDDLISGAMLTSRLRSAATDRNRVAV